MNNKVMLTASRPMRYNTRRLLAGDTFEARVSDAKLLKALGRATDGRPEGEVGQMPERLAERVKHKEYLLGSSLLNAYYQIGDESVQLGKIVAKSHAESGLSVDEWNALSTNDRETRLQETLDAMLSAFTPATPDGGEGNSTGTGEGAGSGDSDGDGDGDDDNGPGVSGTGLVAGNGTSSNDSGLVPPVDVKKDEQPKEEDIQTVREQYHTVVGRRAYAGWDIPTLKEKIAEFEAASKK